MKKIIAIISIILINFGLIGCSLGFYDTDTSLSKKNVNNLIVGLETSQVENVRSFFAPNAIDSIGDIDNSIEKLLSYYDGIFQNMDAFFVNTTDSVCDGKKEKIHRISCDFSTTLEKYRMSIEWRVVDDFDNNNVGIWNLSIIKYEDDLDKESAYWGDGAGQVGIFIGKIHVLNYFNMLKNAIYENCSNTMVKQLFATRKIEGIADFDEQVENLMLYMSGTYAFENWSKPTPFYNESNTIYLMEFDLVTEEKKYCIAIKWCVEDSVNADNIGIWSLYVNEFSGGDDDFYKEHAYIGDGLWTEGINIGIANA